MLKMMFLQGDRGCLDLKEWLHVPVQEPFSPWGSSRAVGSRMHPAQELQPISPAVALFLPRLLLENCIFPVMVAKH